jgi:hypothetical protein
MIVLIVVVIKAVRQVQEAAQVLAVVQEADRNPVAVRHVAH